MALLGKSDLICISPGYRLLSCRIPGEWITARKDWEQAKKRQKAFKKKKANNADSSQDAADPLSSPISEPSDCYDKDTDNLRCILYTHGGGYYFGSIDQERLLVLPSSLLVY